MQEIRRRRSIGWIGVRTHAPQVASVLALLLLVSGLIFVGLSYYRASKQNQPFRLKSGPAVLSSTVTGRIENFERRVTEDDRLTMLVRASLYLQFDDGHHELENVHIEHFARAGQPADKIDARKAIYFVETEEISFAGDVRVETRDGLQVKSEALDYDVKNERAEATVPLTFERENVSGRADAALVDSQHKKLALRGNVEITFQPAAVATVGNLPQPTSARSRPVRVRAPRADFDQNSRYLTFTGGATAEQEHDIMSGETLSAFLNEQKKLQRIEARTNSYLRSMNEGRAVEVHARDMDFHFDPDQRLTKALAVKDVRARTLDADAEVTLTAPNDLQLAFEAQANQSLLREMRAGGRAVVTLAAPRSRASDPQAANKRLTADEVKLFWRVNGRDLERAEAVGNAELIVEPVQATPQTDRKTLIAPRFDCEFYETHNLARVFTATGGAKAVIAPAQESATRDARTLTSQKMIAAFARDTQDIERLDANGDAQFNEADRHGQAANVSYATADEMVRLRGGDPVVWDSRARIKAQELDTDTRREISYARGNTTTTYYSQEQTNGATPFAKVKSPVFIVAQQAEFQHTTGVGIYTGDARAWQDDNFVRADKLILRREQQRLEGEGNVQSALYQARRTDASGNRTVVPVFATAKRMFYANAERLLHYESDVDIKQGTERLTGEVADVYLSKELNEVERTVAQRNVVMTQPGRRGTGDWAQYTAADETMMLTGAPARVEDTEQGSSEGRRLTVYLREKRIVADSPGGPQSTGRVRSTHKVKKQ
ncbi:MAG: LPS export ABC transporter periplasmic protein LptC [Acidobacteriota bacterium]|nr:LPS export ABC transporter periplasmic protein LptC [Acidobacteriota bacterium]